MASNPGGFSRGKREIELDFLRGIAILSVVDFHSHEQIFETPFRLLGFPPIGWVGVDIFFVLSGFLVGGLLVKEWILRGRIDAKQFLIRRGFKIWPQYYIFLIVALLVGHRTFRELMWNFLNLQNYFTGIAHTWSLALEEHAYILLSVILGVAASLRAGLRSVFFFIFGLAILVGVLRVVLSLHGYDTYLTTHTRVDGILYGVLLAILYHHSPNRFRRLQSWTWLWFLVLAAALFQFRFHPEPDNLWGPCNWFLADAGGIAALLLLYHHAGARRSALYRFVAWIGVYSYGIYLWHLSVSLPVASLARRFPSRIQPFADVVLFYAAAILIGVFFTKLIEFPALKLREKLFPRKIDSAVGVPAEIEDEQAKHIPCRQAMPQPEFEAICVGREQSP